MITPKDAIAAYPELAQLFAITQQAPGWVISHKIKDGAVEALSGLRWWPDGTVDQLGIKSQSNAAGRRTNPAGAMVWLNTGTVADVTALMLDELLPPDHPRAPRTQLAQVIAVVNGFGSGLTA